MKDQVMINIGSRAKVWHGTAKRTSGGLKKNDLMINKHGRIVSKKKSKSAKKDKRLEKAGFKPVKGKFGFVRTNLSRKRKAMRGGGCNSHLEEEYILKDRSRKCFRIYTERYNRYPDPPPGARRVNAWPWEGPVRDRPTKK
jgi:hypothetical protein